MKTIKLFSSFILLLVSIINVSCNNSNLTKVPVGDTAQNSLDWNGSYSGILPCADCEGIETTLKLELNNTYTLTTSYLGKINSKEIIKSGTFVWKRNTIVLKGIKKEEHPTIYAVEENRLRQLDQSGEKISGELSQNYVLLKNGNSMVEDKKWRLVNLNGKSINGTAENHYIIFHSKDNKLEAKANCNIMHNKYSIKNNYQVKITSGISTLMSCPDNLEDEFQEVLSSVDNLSVSKNGENLTLNKGRMTPLAIFEIVK